MNRVITFGALVAGLLVAVAGCRGQPPPAAPTATATTVLVLVVLTAGQPTGLVAQPRAPNATVARLNVQAATNASGQGLQVTVALEDTATPNHHVDVGSFSLYPPGQPGVFTLVLPAAAVDLARQGPTVLMVTVAPALAGTPLQPDVRVSLTATLTRP
jgi:hypothetical protein